MAVSEDGDTESEDGDTDAPSFAEPQPSMPRRRKRCLK
jgi:hypothetical protein